MGEMRYHLSEGKAMTRSRINVVAIVLLISTAVVPVYGISDAGAYSVGDSLLDEISGAGIMETVVHLQSFFTREFHTSYSFESAMYIHDEMEALGLQTSIQEFDVDGTTVVNVVSVLDAGIEANGTILIGAHYDSYNFFTDTMSEAENITAPGADDNGSGIGVMLELARVLSQAVPFSATIKFVAFGAEEMGYDHSGGTKGSEAFVKMEAEAGASYDAVFILDMVGYNATQENRATLVCNDASAKLAQTTTEAAVQYGADLSLQTVSNENYTYSDHASFWEAGYQSILLIEELDSSTGLPVNPYYHTSEDTAEKLSKELMTEVAKTVLATIITLTEQGEDSYSTGRNAAIVTILMIAAIATILILLTKRKRGV